jgi:hypothetical protein
MEKAATVLLAAFSVMGIHGGSSRPNHKEVKK